MTAASLTSLERTGRSTGTLDSQPGIWRLLAAVGLSSD
jgi:hypothetical protein